MDLNLLYVSFLTGTVGLAYLVFGKRSGRLVPMGAGLGLMVVPYFLPGMVSLLVVSGPLTAVPFVVRD